MSELRAVLQVTPIPPGPETLQAVKGAQMRIRKFVEEVNIQYQIQNKFQPLFSLFFACVLPQLPIAEPFCSIKLNIPYGVN